MKTEEKSLLSQMREERITAEVIYVKFVSNKKYHNSFAFCFYEGEDGKYYDQRIRERFKDTFITYTVGNKKEVLKLLSRIKESTLYDDVCMMFFVDRDCDDSLRGTDSDLYETPCYSIENLYVKTACYCHILQTEFGLSIGTEDFDRCVKDYESRLNEFNKHMLEFNTIVYARRKMSNSNSNFSFSSVKTSSLVENSICEVSKSAKYKETIDRIKAVLEIDEILLRDTRTELEQNQDYMNDFRGKNQLDFFVSIIMELKKLCKKGEYFKTNLRSVHINITANRLSELSQYAITPDCLKVFLDEHKKVLLA